MQESTVFDQNWSTFCQRPKTPKPHVLKVNNSILYFFLHRLYLWRLETLLLIFSQIFCVDIAHELLSFVLLLELLSQSLDEVFSPDKSSEILLNFFSTGKLFQTHGLQELPIYVNLHEISSFVPLWTHGMLLRKLWSIWAHSFLPLIRRTIISNFRSSWLLFSHKQLKPWPLSFSIHRPNIEQKIEGLFIIPFSE